MNPDNTEARERYIAAPGTHHASLLAKTMRGQILMSTANLAVSAAKNLPTHKTAVWRYCLVISLNVAVSSKQRA